MNSPRRTVDIRRANQQSLLRHLYFHGPMSRLELSQQAGLSPATVTNVIAELQEEDIIVEIGSQESDGGRPRTILAVNPHYGYFVGVGLGETHVQLELFDLTLQIRHTVSHRVTKNENSPENYIEHIAIGIQELMAQADVGEEQILGVGIGVPGMVGLSGEVSAPIWNWENVAFRDGLQARIALPIYLDNGAKAMTLAESLFGVGRGVQDLVVVLIGTGIGSGFITKGSLYRGATNGAGEWGHTKIVLDGRACRCGSRGCLESYAGAPGIITSLRETAPDSSLLASDDQLTILTNLVAAAEQGNVSARQALQDTAHFLGAGIANFVNLVNPTLIIIGGWAGLRIGRTILPDIQKYVEQYALPASYRAVRIELSQLGEDAVGMGMACLVLDAFLSSPFEFKRMPI